MKRALFIILVIGVSVWAAMTLTSNRELDSERALSRDGTPVSVGSVAGAPMTIVHFWGTWCGPCREELPSFAAFKSEAEGRGVAFVTVADDPDFATVDGFLDKIGVQLGTIVLDPRGAAAHDWKVDAYPTTFVLGPDNEILGKYRGMVDWESPLQRREILRLGGLEP